MYRLNCMDNVYYPSNYSGLKHCPENIRYSYFPEQTDWQYEGCYKIAEFISIHVSQDRTRSNAQQNTTTIYVLQSSVEPQLR